LRPTELNTEKSSEVGNTLMQKMVNSVDIITAKCQSAINLEFLLNNKKHTIQTLLDTGADVNCITYKFAKK
jgi:hypothetical protein